MATKKFQAGDAVSVSFGTSTSYWGKIVEAVGTDKLIVQLLPKGRIVSITVDQAVRVEGNRSPPDLDPEVKVARPRVPARPLPT